MDIKARFDKLKSLLLLTSNQNRNQNKRKGADRGWSGYGFDGFGGDDMVLRVEMRRGGEGATGMTPLREWPDSPMTIISLRNRLRRGVRRAESRNISANVVQNNID